MMALVPFCAQKERLCQALQTCGLHTWVEFVKLMWHIGWHGPLLWNHAWESALQPSVAGWDAEARCGMDWPPNSRCCMMLMMAHRQSGEIIFRAKQVFRTDVTDMLPLFHAQEVEPAEAAGHL